MTGTRQFNVRVSDEARDVLARVAARIREDDQFLARITAWLDTIDDDTADDSLAERVARIEARLDEDKVVNLTTPNDTPTSTPDDNPADTPDSNPPWTTGEGRGLRLTPAGVEDIRLRFGAGQAEDDIAAAMGISLNTVRAWRKRIGGQT